MAGSRALPSAPSVVAIFGPTASGKTAVAEAVADRLGGEVLSADSMQAYRGLPILTAQPERPTRLVGIWPLAHEGSVAEYARLAHAAIDELVAAGRTPVVTGGTGLYLRAALAELELPPAPSPEQRAQWEELYDRLGPERAYGVLAAARSRRGGQAASQRQAAGRQGARAHRARLFLATGRRPAVDLRHAPADADLRARRSPRRPERTDRAAGSIDVRRRSGGGGASRACRTDLVHRRPGARSARRGGASARGGARGARRANASLRRVPAEVDATHPGPC